MRTKLKLHLEDLSVESFEATSPRERAGTVVANETGISTCQIQNCPATFALSGCDGCLPTQGCTANPHEFQCLDSMHFCFPSQQTNCADFC
jgi:hypothetical protein